MTAEYKVLGDVAVITMTNPPVNGLGFSTRVGITDGMKVDTKGNIWESGPGGIWILNAQGRQIGHIAVPELVANVAFGDSDHKTLYIPARSGVYKIRVKVEGIP